MVGKQPRKGARKGTKKRPRKGASPEATTWEHGRIMRDSVRIALQMFLAFLTTPGGRWHTAENREEELIQSMKHIQDVLQHAPWANILTQEFVHELRDARKRLGTLGKSMAEDFNSLANSLDSLELFVFQDIHDRAVLLEDGSRRTAPPEPPEQGKEP